MGLMRGMSGAPTFADTKVLAAIHKTWRALVLGLEAHTDRLDRDQHEPRAAASRAASTRRLFSSGGRASDPLPLLQAAQRSYLWLPYPRLIRKEAI